VICENNLFKEQIELLQKCAIENGNIFEQLMTATKYCSLGQITESLFEVGRQYRRNMCFFQSNNYSEKFVLR